MDGRLGKSQPPILDHGIDSLRYAGLRIVLASASVWVIGSSLLRNWAVRHCERVIAFPFDGGRQALSKLERHAVKSGPNFGRAVRLANRRNPIFTVHAR